MKKKKNKKTSVKKVKAKVSRPKVKKRAPAKPAKKTKRNPAGKTKTSFSSKELGDIKEKLTEIKGNLIKTIEDKQKYDLVENDVGDQIDEAAQSLEKEVLFELSDNERQILDDVEAALRKMENNKYGKCEHCGGEIDKKRLRAIPHSRYCIACQVSNEKYR
ncbi:MAG: hypothetical protein COT17_01565 [Elusimicrobia bacterium CG08_land_8_20_14_0_20_51_18]|nr:MAG: hypothetical protein COT17_01565 [Elusimicrobia bacterium CG08_land_8_20_14_0_20_51_18]